MWGLDDYQFMPFIWGSAQLDGNPVLRPKSILNPDVLETYGNEYLYLGAVHFVTQVLSLLQALAHRPRQWVVFGEGFSLGVFLFGCL